MTLTEIRLIQNDLVKPPTFSQQLSCDKNDHRFDRYANIYFIFIQLQNKDIAIKYWEQGFYL